MMMRCFWEPINIPCHTVVTVTFYHQLDKPYLRCLREEHPHAHRAYCNHC